MQNLGDHLYNLFGTYSKSDEMGWGNVSNWEKLKFSLIYEPYFFGLPSHTLCVIPIMS